LYKTLFATNFVENIYEFYNFVGNNYSPRNYLSIKILEEIEEKSVFLQIFLTNLQENCHVIWEFLVMIRNESKNSEFVSNFFFSFFKNKKKI